MARHKSIIAYLSSINLSNSAAALREELQIGDTFDAATSKKYEGLLEKKWTSVVRLQKKVMGSASGEPQTLTWSIDNGPGVTELSFTK